MSSVVDPKSRCMVGIATLTMLTSSTDMNMPVISTTIARPQPFWGARAGAGGAGGGAVGRGAGEGGAGGAGGVVARPFVRGASTVVPTTAERSTAGVAIAISLPQCDTAAFFHGDIE